MALFRWPTDPPGKAASHTKTYDQHINDEKIKAKGTPSIGAAPNIQISAPGGGFVPVSSWDFGYGKGVLAPPTPPVGAAPSPGNGSSPETPRAFSPDSIYNTGIGNNKRAYDDTITNLGTDESKIKYDFGFDDPTNPFNRSLEQKRAFLIQGAAASNQLASRGQLFSGANAKRQGDIAREQEKQTAALKAQYAAALEEIKRRRTAAGIAHDTADLDTFRDAMIRQGVA